MLIFLIMPLVGSVNVTLQNMSEKDERCWGTVEVCKNEKCGGVCKIESEDSVKICNDLGCGKPIQSPLKNRSPTEYRGSVTHYSVYCLNEVKNISMCRFIPISDSSCRDPAQVICTGNVYGCFVQTVNGVFESSFRL